MKNVQENAAKFGKQLAAFSKKKVDSNPVYKEKYIKTKIKGYSKKISTDFHGNKKPKESSEWNFARFPLQKR